MLVLMVQQSIRQMCTEFTWHSTLFVASKDSLLKSVSLIWIKFETSKSNYIESHLPVCNIPINIREIVNLNHSQVCRMVPMNWSRIPRNICHFHQIVRVCNQTWLGTYLVIGNQMDWLGFGSILYCSNDEILISLESFTGWIKRSGPSYHEINWKYIESMLLNYFCIVGLFEVSSFVAVQHCVMQLRPVSIATTMLLICGFKLFIFSLFGYKSHARLFTWTYIEDML